MPTILITGATRGLGRAAARAARGHADVLVTGRDAARTRQAAAEVGGEPVVLTLDSLTAVVETAASLPYLDAVVCNAGLQIPGEVRTPVDGFEETFQVNFLGHLALIDALLARERPPARIVWIGSATHDPAQHSGLPHPREEDIRAISRGDVGAGRRAGQRRYTTSKLLTTAVTGALARDRPDLHVCCLDPGLMTGTGLAREYPGPVGRVYMALGRAVALLPFASTPERSGAELARLAVDAPSAPSGTTVDWRGRSARISVRAQSPAFQDEVLAVARGLLRNRPSSA